MSSLRFLLDSPGISEPDRLCFRAGEVVVALKVRTSSSTFPLCALWSSRDTFSRGPSGLVLAAVAEGVGFVIFDDELSISGWYGRPLELGSACASEAACIASNLSWLKLPYPATIGACGALGGFVACAIW